MSADSQIFRSTTVSFADVAHQNLIFDRDDPASQLVLSLIDTRWVQRLRNIRQTGNTHLVYMFAEHSRFGHSLGVAYLATLLMDKLAHYAPNAIHPYRDAVAAAALLHDIGHVAPGSHIATHIWAPTTRDSHEQVSVRIIREDQELVRLLEARATGLVEQVSKILTEDRSLPHWTTAIISGGGWNADRGNWAIVDSAMCAVSYGRYNVNALIDAFRLTRDGLLVIQENRLDALTHFYVARDSMYRQVYQHRVLQAADALNDRIVMRVRDLLHEANRTDRLATLRKLKIFCDPTMEAVLGCENYTLELPLEAIFRMTESWWRYHLECWTESLDPTLSDLSTRLLYRNLFKTVRLEARDAAEKDGRNRTNDDTEALIVRAKQITEELGFPPRYYFATVENTDRHRGRLEEIPMVLLDNGSLVPVVDVEPMIATLLNEPAPRRAWLVVPNEVKEKLGRSR